MSHYDECVREWTLREGFREGAKLTEGLTETNKTKVCCRTSARNYFCFKDAEFDSRFSLPGIHGRIRHVLPNITSRNLRLDDLVRTEDSLWNPSFAFDSKLIDFRNNSFSKWNQISFYFLVS